MIIDSHLHFPVLKKRDFEKSKIKLLKDMKKNKIDYAITIPDNLHNSVIPDLETSLELIKNNQNLLLMGTLDILRDKKPSFRRLDQLLKQKKIIAIKIFPGHDPYYPTDKRLIPAIKLCIKYNKPFVIHTGWNSKHPEVAKYNDPKHIIKLAKKYPKLRIIIAHYFWPRLEYCYEITKNFKNIYFDTSVLADDEVIQESGLKTIKKTLEKTINGNSERVLFGTDYGICTFKSHINLINSLKITEKQKQKVFYENAIKLFGLKMSKKWK